MRYTASPWKLVFCAVLVMGGCRPEPGAPDYASQEEFNWAEEDEATEEPLEGPDPFTPGEPRLSLGAFYEGGSSIEIAIDEVTRHFYIYQDEGTGELTFSQTSSTDRLEGLRSDEVVHNGGGWWGGGIHWDSPFDLSDWKTLHIGMKATDSAFDTVHIAMESEETSLEVQVSDYGFSANGEWHMVSIPLSVFAESGVEMEAITIPMRMGGVGGDAGATLLIDNLYLTQ